MLPPLVPRFDSRVVSGTIPGFDTRPMSGISPPAGARYSMIVPKSSAPQIALEGWLVYPLIHRSTSQIDIFREIGCILCSLVEVTEERLASSGT